MNMTENNLLVEITRKEGKLYSVKAIMPTWTRKGSDGQLYAKMPFIGEQETVGADELDLEVAVNEAFASFCIIAERFGLGVEKEFAMLGWQIQRINDESSLLNRILADAVLEDVLSTGDTRTLNFDAPSYAYAAA